MKQNCWQLKKCERQPGGSMVGLLGVCSAAADPKLDGLNGGKNGGRICWAIAGTFCGGVVQGTFTEKRTSCLSCEVYLKVRHEEGISCRLLPPGQCYRPAKKVFASRQSWVFPPHK